MKSKFAILALALLLMSITDISHGAAPNCANPRLRKEIRDLSTAEWNGFISAVMALKRSGRYDEYTTIHQQYTANAHGGSFFFPWHRRMIYDFETEVMRLSNGTLSGLPYFDPQGSYNIFDPSSPHYVGTPSGCIVDGPFANIVDTNGQCVQRGFNDQVTAADPRVIASLILTQTPFATFSTTYEYGQHAQVHAAVGGHMAGLTTSTNDPFFFLHHAHVDYIWYKRQWFNPSTLYWDLNGVHGTQPVNLNVLVPGPWGQNVGLGSQISDTYWTFCYDYQDPSSTTNTRLSKRQDPNEGSAPSSNTAGNNVGTVTSKGIFQPLDPNHIRPITPLNSDQLKQFEIDPEAYNTAIKQMNDIADQLNERLKKGEKVEGLSDIKKSDQLPAQKPVTGGADAGVLEAGAWSVIGLLMAILLTCYP